jgi:hypothetical protein
MSGEAPSQYCRRCCDPLSMCCCDEPVIVNTKKRPKPREVSSSDGMCELKAALRAMNLLWDEIRPGLTSSRYKKMLCVEKALAGALARERCRSHIVPVSDSRS